jgi:hypothetical protein
MKSIVAIYDSHWNALDAVKILKNIGYPVSQLSMIGQVTVSKNNMLRKANRPRRNAGIFCGLVLDSALRVLQGAGIFDVPGCGFVFGAGALKKEIAGIVVGFDGDGMESILRKVGIKKETTKEYSKHLADGMFLVIAQGNEIEVEKAKNILYRCGKHLEL